MISESHRLLSNIATNDRHGENSPYFDGWQAYERAPFHPSKNPEGTIQMGLAENQVYIYMLAKPINFKALSNLCDNEMRR